MIKKIGSVILAIAQILMIVAMILELLHNNYPAAIFSLLVLQWSLKKPSIKLYLVREREDKND